MKKTVKSLMVALFVLGAMVMGISCQKDAPSLDKVEKSDLVFAAGNYELKAKLSGKVSVDEGGMSMSATVTESMTMLAEVKGTNPTDEVIMSNGVMEVSEKITMGDDASYAMMKLMMGEDSGIVFDDASKTISMVMKEEMDEDDYIEVTYAEFVDGLIDLAADGEVKNVEIFQNKDGSKTKITFDLVMESEFGDLPLKGTLEVTRK